MSGPKRTRLPDRRPSITERRTWRQATGQEFRFHVTVGFAPEVGVLDEHFHTMVARPLEVFLRPAGQRWGSFLQEIADDVGEMLSLLLQHGHDLAALRARFKPGSLAHAVVGWIGEIQRGPQPEAAP